MFSEQLRKSKYYTQWKEHFTKNKSAVDGNDIIKFFENCNKAYVVPLPAMAKIEQGELNLAGYKLN